jgi:hypothetical protein
MSIKKVAAALEAIAKNPRIIDELTSDQDPTVRVLRTLMRDAVGAFELHQDPTAHIVFPTSGEDDPDEDEDEVEDSARTLNAEELTRFLAALKKKRPGQYALVATLAMTGLRFCHASALRWTDIDEAGGIIRTRRKNARARVGKVTRKKNAPRRYPLHPELAEILRAHRAYLLKRQHRGLANGWCFPSKTGGLQRPSSLIKCFRPEAELADFVTGAPLIFCRSDEWWHPEAHPGGGLRGSRPCSCPDVQPKLRGIARWSFPAECTRPSLWPSALAFRRIDRELAQRPPFPSSTGLSFPKTSCSAVCLTIGARYLHPALVKAFPSGEPGP